MKDQDIRNVRRVTAPVEPQAGELGTQQAEAAAKVAGKAVEAAGGWRMFLFITAATTKVYIIQIFFAVICFIGLALLGGLESSWMAAADFVTFGSVENIGAGLFILGGAGAMLCGIVTAMVASALSLQSPLRGLSPLILTVCLVALLCPVVNFFPIMWLWCLYMAWPNTRL